MAGIAVTSFVPVLSDLERRQRYRGLERRQPQLLSQVHCDILRYRCDAVGSRRNNRSGNEARQTEQYALREDFGLQRMLGHMMRRMPNIRGHDDDVMRATKSSLGTQLGQFRMVPPNNAQIVAEIEARPASSHSISLWGHNSLKLSQKWCGRL
jgi:hypothetical protein